MAGIKGKGLLTGTELCKYLDNFRVILLFCDLVNDSLFVNSLRPKSAFDRSFFFCFMYLITMAFFRDNGASDLDKMSAAIFDVLVSLAFAGSIGMTFVILACALPSFEGVWWPFFVVLFYVLSPIPTLIARRHTDGTAGTNSPCMEVAIFITMGIIVSSFGLPIVLARASKIAGAACYLTLVGNVIVYLTILGFFTIFDMDDNDYAMW